MANLTFIPSLDCTELSEALRIVKLTCENPQVYGYKVGFSLGLTYGLPKIVSEIKNICALPVIYDHQKAGTDIPDTGNIFAKTLRQAGIEEAIIFPQAGHNTLLAWAQALVDMQIKVIVGGGMTHAGYTVSEGGYLDDLAVHKMYHDAITAGVTSFVVPLTKPIYAEKIAAELKEKIQYCDFYSPGFGAQGGSPANFTFLPNHKIIIGRSLLNASCPKKWLEDLCNSLNKN